MEESPSVTNLQVSHHIPDDIILSILSKLPLKSFKRFQCVHKSWSLLSDDPYFMTIYRNNFLLKDCSYLDDTCLLVGVRDGLQYIRTKMGSVLVDDLYYLSGKNFENSVKLDWPNPFPEDEHLVQVQVPDEDEDYSGFGIMGSVNGILCLCTFHHDDTEWRLILWNPANEEFIVIPYSPFELDVDSAPEHHILGYDSIEGDYKVIRFVECYYAYGDDDDDDDDYVDDHGNVYDDDGLATYWEIYSLNDNLWSKIDGDVPLFSGIEKDVYMDGVSHWLDKNETHTYLVSFDFNKESFTTTPTPSYIDDDSFEVLGDLVILNGSIAFILNYEKASAIHISILGELGVKESWTKLFVVESSPCLYYPIVSAKKGKILFTSRDKTQNKLELVWFDLRSGMIDTIDLTKRISGCLSSIHTVP